MAIKDLIQKWRLVKANKKLIKEFPFLLPRNRWTGEVPKDYDYSYTELDAMPEAWRESFGIQMCREIKESLVKANYLNEYRITQIKEKYGSLRWYDFGHTAETGDIIRKYENLSMCYCIKCGKPVRYRTEGWVEYLCEDCKTKEINNGMDENYFIRLTEEDIPHTYEYSPNGEKIEKNFIDFKKLWGLEE